MVEQRALARAAAAHDDENVAAVDGEVQVALQHEIAVGHGQAVHLDVRVAVRRREIAARAIGGRGGGRGGGFHG